MVARHQLDGMGLRPSRRQLMIGAGTLAMATSGFALSALAQTARIYSPADFEPYIDQGFLVVGNNINAALQLVEIKSYPRDNRPASLPDPFSLIFRQFGGGEPLPAELVQIEHPGLDRILVYLNPITKDPSYYEVAFN